MNFKMMCAKKCAIKSMAGRKYLKIEENIKKYIYSKPKFVLKIII
jgi:hypothetical protein